MSRPVTSELVARSGAALAQGGWRYTPRQLYYATCAAAETPPRAPARAELGLGVLLGLVALILLPFHLASLAVGILAILALAFGAVTRLTAKPRSGRVLAVSYPEFEALLAGATPPAGLIDAATATATVSRGAPPDRALAAPADVVVVCDTAESAAAVAANLALAGIARMPVLTLDAAEPCGDTVVALHDASPRGCALPLELQQGSARVIDAGLRPAWVQGADVQVLEGAPARLPRELSPLLSDDELDWLRSGRRVELAVLPPERLMALVQAALTRSGPLADPSPQPMPAPAPLESPFAARP